MPRRRAVVATVAVLGLALAEIALPQRITRVHATSGPPNVLIIVTDDQRFDELATMPNVTRIFGSGGTKFNKAYAETPLCCPSRATIMTGRYTHNHGVTKNGFDEVSNLDFSTTAARYLHDAGYRTGIAGKIFNGWPTAKAPPYFDRYAVTRSGYNNASFYVDGQVRTDTGYSTAFISNQAIAFLDSFEQDDDAAPWLLHLAPFAPHWPYTPATQDASATVKPLATSPARAEANRSDKPPAVQQRSSTLASVQAAWTGQVRSLRAVDRMVDRVFDRLAELGEENTLAFFVSDNGYLLAEHGIGEDKQFPYTHAIRVPMLMRWPGHVSAGAIDTRRVLNADIAPTVLAAAGIALPASPAMDGRDLLAPIARTRTFVEFFTGAEPESPTESTSPPSWATLVTDTYQYTEWYAADEQTVTFREYYNLTTDPDQLANLLGDNKPSNDPSTTKLAALHDSLAHDRTCAGTTGTSACP